MFRLLPISKTSSNAAVWDMPLPKGHTGSLTWLLGLLVCYQAVNQIILGSTLHGDVDEGECGFVEGKARAPWCAEAQLFRSWQAASTAEVLFDLEQVLRSEGAEESQLLLAQADDEPGLSLPAPLQPSRQTAGHADAPAVPSTSVPMQQDSASPVPSTSAPVRHAAPASNLSSLRNRLEALEQAVASKPTEKPIEADASEKGTLQEQIAMARCEMCQVPHRQNYSECTEFRAVTSCNATLVAAPHGRDGLTRWMEELVALQSGFESRMAARRAGGPKNDSTEELPVLEQIDSLGCEMCLEPHRSGYPECVHFLSTSACLKARRVTNRSGQEIFDAGLANISAQHKEWDAKVAASVAAFKKELCADPLRSGYSACAGVSLAHVDAASDAASGTSRLSSAPASPSLRGGSRSQEALVVHRHDLDHVWFPSLQGKIPKAACIAVIPQGWGALSQVPHLVKGFRNQTYEGDSILILVYHFHNREAAGVVQSYADGARIYAVAARGDAGDFPSAAAFRFGAWRAEQEGAEVVARWDLDAWHGPRRLAMQVRALTLSKRPACVLGRWRGPRSKSGAGSSAGDGMLWGDRTLVGKADWMRRHWYPFIAQEKALDEGPDKSDIAVLDMPELFIFVSPDASAGAH